MGEGERQPDRGTVAASRAVGERRPGLRAAGLAAKSVAAPILARHGGVLARLKAGWAAAVGAELAAVSWPENLSRDGALKLRVRPAFALEIQHSAPLLIERVNLYLGRAAISRLSLVQGPLPLAAPSRAPPPPLLDPAEQRALDASLADVADPELREALAGLGRLVLAGKQAK